VTETAVDVKGFEPLCHHCAVATPPDYLACCCGTCAGTGQIIDYNRDYVRGGWRRSERRCSRCHGKLFVRCEAFEHARLRHQLMAISTD
jgi:hypothetical protein